MTCARNIEDMMKLRYCIYALAAIFMLAACDDYNEQLDGFDSSVGKPKDVKNETYIATSNDYAKISAHSGIASISANKAFDNDGQAHECIPYLLSDVYAVADNGSVVRVGYFVVDDAMSCLTRLRKAKSYTLADEDYSFIHEYADRKMPSSVEERLRMLLLEKMAGAAEGDIVMVNFEDNALLTGKGYASDNNIIGFSSSLLYEFDGASWRNLSSADNVAAIMPTVYQSMGVDFIENGDEVVPMYLNKLYPYAKKNDIHTVAYYYNKYKDIGALKYKFDDGGWIKIGESFKVTRVQNQAPFVLADGIWRYDPSVTVELPAAKKNAVSMKYYQAMVDWVWANVDQAAGVDKGKGYVAKYGDTDFYTGANAYSCVVDWNVSNARKQCAEAYKDMSDEEVVAFMQANFIEVLGRSLSVVYPEALPVEGLDVLYTVIFTARMDADVRYTIKYKVVDKAAFQYVEGSMKPL